MKRITPLLLVLVLLTACGTKAETVMEVLEVPAFALPETAEAEPISSEAVVTEGRAPAEDYDLPLPREFSPENSWMRYDIDGWLRGGTIGLLAEAPEAGAAFYGLPYSENAHETALIRWGNSLAEFDWDFLTPRRFLPRMAVMDLDGDGKDELIVLTYVGSGTGVSIYDLHVLEKNPDGTLTDYAMPGSLWQERLPPLLRFVQTDGRNFLILGRELLEIDMEHVLEGQMEPSAGWIANFRLLPEEHAIQLLGAVDLWKTTNYVADYTADVGYRDGVFTLSGFHLQ
ncbi:hypothetical protein [uncultured Oscillibacter sp.]|uniref:hypothetical protein n=1 Tax=uncultured Oscillibacter sp. TaxID=876091 RepID=UPI0026082B30|nr:hypothetical protein [uncultured Oscillibacter sp.]